MKIMYKGFMLVLMMLCLLSCGKKDAENMYGDISTSKIPNINENGDIEYNNLVDLWEADDGSTYILRPNGEKYYISGGDSEYIAVDVSDIIK